MEQWKPIREFPNYSVSDHGHIRNDKSGRILAVSQNQFGVACVGLVRDGRQYHRSVPKLVAWAFIPHPRGPFDTPLNLDGNRLNNHVDNIVWRPRWFVVKYYRQFKVPYRHPIQKQIQDMETGETSMSSFDCALRYGLLEEDVVLSILNRTYTWPTYQEFRVVED